MLNCKRFIKGIQLLGVSSTAVSLAGEMEFLASTTNKFVAHNGSSASPLVTESHSATLTNKNLSDSTVPVVNVSDATKQLLFSLGGGTTGKTTTLSFAPTNNRTITFPDASDTVVYLTTTQVLTNKSVADPSDTTKALTWSLSGATTGKTVTFSFSHTNNRTITFPDASDQLVGRATTDTLTNKTINGANNTLTVRLASDVSGNLPLANMASIASNTILGNNTGGSTTPTALTASQVNTLLGSLSNPMTTLGDTIYGGASGTPSRLAGDTSNTRKFLRTVSSGGVAAAPAWDTIAQGDLPTIALTSDVTGSASAGSIATTVAKIQGTTVSGTTGTTNVVFSASPTITGSPNIGSGDSNTTIINNSTSKRTLLIQNQDTTSGSDGEANILFIKGSTTNSSSQQFVLFTINASGTTSGQIVANGAGAVAFATTSDEQLKTNVTPLQPHLDKIMQLRPVEFEYRDKAKHGHGRQHGFIAQEMQKVFPDVVGKSKDGTFHIAGWDKTSARIVAAIQELKQEYDKLRAEFSLYKAEHP